MQANPAVSKFDLNFTKSGPRRLHIHELLESQVQIAPDATAIVHDWQFLNSALLNEQADRIASRLRRSGVSQETLTGLYFERSIEAAIGVLGVLKAGGAYVPLDPHYPTSRVVDMIEDSGLRVVLTRSDLADTLPRHSGVEVLSLDLILAEADDHETPADTPVAVGPENAAFVIFTSGSTGRPKGTVVTHRSLLNRLASTPLPDIQPQDICAWNSSLNFGISSSRLLLPLALGATVVVLSESQVRDVREFARAVKDHGITSFFAVPSFLRQLLLVDDSVIEQLRSVRAIAAGGGAFTTDLFQELSNRLPHVQFVNLYGSTEIGTTASLKVLHRGQPVSIGTPVRDTRIYLLDSKLVPVPDGAVGEIYVGSPHLARGYLNRPELTSERFLPSPFVAGERICRTGDLGRRLSNGEIEFAGRVDNQVKVRGFRIELEEIEAALLKHPAVFDAVAAVRPRGMEERLVGYIVARPGSASRPDDLRAHLSTTLPDYMIPSVFMLLERLPQTAAGKVDRGALPEPPSERPDLQSEYQAPRIDKELTMAGIWADVLRLERVGIHDDFFALGGDSLAAAQMLFRVADALHVDLSIEDFRKQATVAAIAMLLSDAQERCVSGIEPVPREEEIPVSLNQEFMLASEIYRDIRGMNPWSPNTGFGFLLEGRVDCALVQDAIDEIVERHEALRTGFVPTAMIGSLQLEGWPSIRQVLGNGPLRPKIRFTARPLASAHAPLDFHDLSTLEPAERASEVPKLTRHAIETPHDYGSALLRATLIRTGPADHLLILGVSHLAFDGWSRGIFQKELASFYRESESGIQPDLPKLRIQYGDFARWQRETLQGDRLRNLVELWKHEFEAYPPTTASDLPDARETANASGNVGRIAVRVLSAPLVQAVDSFITRIGTTLYTLLFSGVGLLLSSLTKRERVAIGAYFANRTSRETEHLIGDFATLHLVGVAVSPDETVQELIAGVQERIAWASRHQELPYGLFLSLIGRDKRIRLPQSPPISCELIGSAAPTTISALTIRRMDRIRLLSDLSRCQSPLRILCYRQEGEGIKIAASYHAAKFDDHAIEAMLRRLTAILEEMVRAPNTTISRLASLGASL